MKKPRFKGEYCLYDCPYTRKKNQCVAYDEERNADHFGEFVQYYRCNGCTSDWIEGSRVEHHNKYLEGDKVVDDIPPNQGGNVDAITIGGKVFPSYDIEVVQTAKAERTEPFTIIAQTDERQWERLYGCLSQPDQDLGTVTLTLQDGRAFDVPIILVERDREIADLMNVIVDIVDLPEDVRKALGKVCRVEGEVKP